LNGPSGAIRSSGLPPRDSIERRVASQRKGRIFDGHRATAQPADQLGFVGDQDESPAGVGDDLLSQQRPAAPLDAVDGRVDLVGPVDGQVE